MCHLVDLLYLKVLTLLGLTRARFKKGSWMAQSLGSAMRKGNARQLKDCYVIFYTISLTDDSGIRMSCFAVDFSHQEDAEGCHAFCGKVDGCNLWSWKPSQSLCLAFATCTFAEGPVCEDCVIGEKLWVKQLLLLLWHVNNTIMISRVKMSVHSDDWGLIS